MLLSSVSSLLLLASTALSQGFVPPDEPGRHGNIMVECSDSDVNGGQVLPTDTGDITTSAYTTRTEIFKGKFRMYNDALEFDTVDEKTFHVAVDRHDEAGTPVVSFSMNKMAPQKGWGIENGYVHAPNNDYTFYVCKGSQYPNNNVVAYFKNRPKDASVCTSAKLKWNEIYY